MAVLTINNVAVKAPSKLMVLFADVGSRVDRNAAGGAVIDRAARKRTLECEWRYLKTTDLQTIAQNAGRASVFFPVTYYDPETSADKTITCYLGKLEAGMQRYANGAVVGWEDVKLEMIER